MFGLLWIKYVKKDVEEMQNKPLRDWHVHKLNEEERERLTAGALCGGGIAWWRGGSWSGWLVGLSIPSAISTRFLLPPSRFILLRRYS